MKSEDKTNPSVLVNCEDICKKCLVKFLNLPIEVRTEYVYESSSTNGGATGPLPPPELENNSETPQDAPLRLCRRFSRGALLSEAIIKENLSSFISLKKLVQVLTFIRSRYYNQEIYLVGSILSSLNPRDIDVVVEIEDSLFEAMYGKSLSENESVDTWIAAIKHWNKGLSPVMVNYWQTDIAKQSKELTLMCGLQIDFKTQPSKLFNSIQLEKYKLEV